MSNDKNTAGLGDVTRKSAWYNPAWKKRKRISVPGDRFNGRVENYPLLIDLGNDPEVIGRSRADGWDIVFTAADGTTPLPHQRVVHQRLLCNQAVWTIWSGPRAIRHVGIHDRTYIAYYTTNQGWWISAYDHNQNQWQHKQLRSHDQSSTGRWWDDHNNPALTVRNDGRIMAVYGEHSTERSWSRVSTNPEDITSWENEIPFTQEQKIAKRSNHWLKYFMKRVWAKLTSARRPKLYEPAYSYVNLYTFPDGTIWRQYRPLTGWSGISRNPTFVLSRDGGSTWSNPVHFIEEKNRSPYLVTAQDEYKIHFLFSDAHPDEWNKTSIYHAYYDHSHGTYHKSDGTLIGDHSCLPFTPAQATRIFDGTTPAGEAWVYDVAVDAKGRIAGLFNVYSGEKDGKSSYQVHEYWYAIWDGTRWQTNRIDSESDLFSTGQRRYSGGFAADTGDIFRVYLSLVDPDGSENSFTRHIWRYQTQDNGASWTRARVTREGQGKAHSRPVVPVNRHPDMPVFWQYGHYVNYLEYWTALAAENHGALADSQHYVQIPRIDPEEDLNIYVYYDNKSVSNDPSLPRDKVWPSSCHLSYRGTLTQNDLGSLPSRQIKSGITIEIVAVWASDRKGAGEAAIIASNPASKTRLWVGKSGDNTLEVRLRTHSGHQTIVFDDLAFRTRPWKEAHSPVERSVIQLNLNEDGTVHARMNAFESRITGEIRGLRGISPADLGRLQVAPESEQNMPFQGWIEAIRVYYDQLNKDWLDISAITEIEGASLIHVSGEEYN